MHAGWISLAALLNVAQVIVAFHLLPVSNMLPWTLLLFTLTALVVLTVVARLRGKPLYTLGGLWGLVGVFVQQRESDLDGASTAAAVAMALAAAVALLSLCQLLRPLELLRHTNS